METSSPLPTKTQNQNDADVIIVGGGPVGMGLSIELGQRGVRCVVVERYEQPQPIPKGQNLTTRTMEHFHAWGAEKQLRAARTIPPEYGIGGLTTYGTLLSPYFYNWLQRDLVKPYYFQANERLPQYATEAVLRKRVSELPQVKTMYGWEADECVQTETSVSVTIRDKVNNNLQILSADYLVGSDGARSRIRERAGITHSRTDHDRLMVLLVFRSVELHRLLERYPDKAYYKVMSPGLQGYWKFFGRVDLGSTWFFHAPVPPGTTADNFDFGGFLQEAVGAPIDIELRYVGFWDLRFMLADSYRKGRVFIAGDAAHSHPPYGGYGVNAGLEDARNLGWKLAATLQGWGSAGLLDSYDAERRPVFRSTIDDFIANLIEDDRIFLESHDPEVDRDGFEKAWQERAAGTAAEVHSFEPNYEGSPVVWPNAAGDGVCSAKGSHVFQARSGHHLAPARMSSGKNVFEALGDGFTLLAIGMPQTTIDRFQRTAAELNLPLTVCVAAPEGEVLRYDAALVLVRPDEFVAWTGDARDVGYAEIRKVLQLVQTGASGSQTAPDKSC